MLGMTDVLDGLMSRLPELEWRLGEIGAITEKQLPRGLFRCAEEGRRLDAVCYIREIKSDIEALGRQREIHSERYLVEKVSQKIHVLLQLCQLARRKTESKPRAPLSVHRLSTRQQWLGQLQDDIDRLMVQQQALRRAVEEKASLRAPDAMLALQRELGEITRYLVMAEEAFAVASGGAQSSSCQ
jgi:hypothetical protein